ncbi:SRPBCC family protein [Geobacter sp. DSM 9736]|uniref:SRPBCC family protein n=1 Tax=Geobacter sp. DSM 9736 TaxID=1277350 RepID=UPI000B50F6FA|nr:SRPBCC family protein [Geobacter sp. DSM 9736]SNB47501.1 Uncharacterized membrane protein [Geobacter sp. DSM 9736]
MATSQAAAHSRQFGGEEQQETTGRKINVGRTERKASMVGGATLALAGISRISKGRFLPGLAMLAAGGMVFYRGKTGHCDMYETLGVNTAGTSDTGLEFEKSVTINRSPQEVYEFWRHLENIPRFMRHVDSVQRTGERTSHWKASGPRGTTVEWDAETTEDHPGRISWRSLEGAQVPNQGTVEFREASGGRGTEMKVRIAYTPPAGAVGKVAGKILNQITAQQIEEDLKRFKQILETGETATSATHAQKQAVRSFMPGGGAVPR